MNDNLSTLALAPTGRSLPIALLRARERILVPIRRMLAEAGVSEPQWRILRVLAEGGPMSGHQLAKAACLQPASVSRILQGMVQKQQIARVQDMRNRRRQIVSICPLGTQLLADYSAASRRITDAIEGQFGAKKYRQLLSLLDEFNAMPINYSQKP